MNTSPLDSLLRFDPTSGSDSRALGPVSEKDDFVRILQQASTPRETTPAAETSKTAAKAAPPTKSQTPDNTPATAEKPPENEPAAASTSQEEHDSAKSDDDSPQAAQVSPEKADQSEDPKSQKDQSDEVAISEAAAAAAGQSQLKETQLQEALSESPVESAEVAAPQDAADENPQQQTARQQAAAADEAVQATAEPQASTDAQQQPITTDNQPKDAVVEVVDEAVLTDTEVQETEPEAKNEEGDKAPRATHAEVAQLHEPAAFDDAKTPAQQVAASTSKAVNQAQPTAEAAATSTLPTDDTGETQPTKRAKRGTKFDETVEEQPVAELETPDDDLSLPDDSTKVASADGKAKTTPATPSFSGADQPTLATNGPSGPTPIHARHDAAGQTANLQDPVPTENRVRFVHRVAGAFRHAQQNDGQIQLRLSPPELGSLKIEITVRNGVLSANLETETSEARRVVLDNLPALRHRLAEQEIRIDKFEVDVRRDGGQPGNQDQWDQQQSRQAQRNNTNRPQASLGSETLRTRPATISPQDNDGLDVRI